MSGFKDLGLGGKLDALNHKIVKLEQEVTGLRSDMRKILVALSEQSIEKSPVDPSGN